MANQYKGDVHVIQEMNDEDNLTESDRHGAAGT